MIADQAKADAGVLIEICVERARQDEQWGGADHDDDHGQLDWIRFIERQLEESQIHGQFRQRMIKVAALAVAAIEADDRWHKAYERKPKAGTRRSNA